MIKDYGEYACIALGLFGLFAILYGCGVDLPFGSSTYARELRQARMRARKPYRWLVLGAVLWLAGGSFYVLVVHRAMNPTTLDQAEAFARETFREKLGQEPEELQLNPVDRSVKPELWKHTGTARCQGVEYDVVVVKKPGPLFPERRTVTECVLTPR